VVEGDGLENRSAKAPGVRIPPPPPSEAEIDDACGKLQALLDRHGLLLLHDATFPSATACIAGGPIRGSWWGHAKGKLIYETLTRMEDDVVSTKLVLGKETLVHRRLWPALVAAAACGQRWQERGLRADAKQLLDRIREGEAVRPDEPPAGRGSPRGRKVAVIANDLERRLLVHSRSEHTPSGRHVRFLETWATWARRNRVGRADLPDAHAALQALAAPVMAWSRGRLARGLLPWIATR
jgi:hypothetical protein